MNFRSLLVMALAGFCLSGQIAREPTREIPKANKEVPNKQSDEADEPSSNSKKSEFVRHAESKVQPEQSVARKSAAKRAIEREYQ